jgi:uncharacterized protein YijF (DUF1287 family)
MKKQIKNLIAHVVVDIQKLIKQDMKKQYSIKNI